MPTAPQPPLWKRLLSHFVSFVEAEVPSQAGGPTLEVVYSSGRYQLHAATANYSFGELHTAFADVFQEVDISNRKPQKVLVLGLGAGSIPRLLAQMHPRCHITGVEVDPAVIALGKSYFGLDEYANLDIVQTDARTYLAGCTASWDMICVDIFLGAETPVEWDAPEVLSRLQALLAPGGLLIWNRLALSAAQLARTEHFMQLASLTMPNPRVHRVLSNHFLICEKPHSPSVEIPTSAE